MLLSPEVRPNSPARRSKAYWIRSSRPSGIPSDATVKCDFSGELPGSERSLSWSNTVRMGSISSLIASRALETCFTSSRRCITCMANVSAAVMLAVTLRGSFVVCRGIVLYLSKYLRKAIYFYRDSAAQTLLRCISSEGKIRLQQHFVQCGGQFNFWKATAEALKWRQMKQRNTLTESFIRPQKQSIGGLTFMLNSAAD